MPPRIPPQGERKVIIHATALTVCAAAWAGVGYLTVLILDKLNR